MLGYYVILWLYVKTEEILDIYGKKVLCMYVGVDVLSYFEFWFF